MDILVLMQERLQFIRRHYEVVNGHFQAIADRIRRRESPYDVDPPGFDSEDAVPPYLDEWMAMDEHMEFVGVSCVSYLAANLKIFFDEMRENFSNFSPLPAFDVKLARETGYFAANQKWFQEIGIDFTDSGVNLAIIEEIVTTRNSAQHPRSLITMAPKLEARQVKLDPPIPWFAHPFERDGVDPDDPGTFVGMSWTVSVTPETFLPAIREVRKLCEFVFNKSRELQDGEMFDKRKPDIL